MSQYHMSLRPRLILVVAVVSFVGVLASLANWRDFGDVREKVNTVLRVTLPDLHDGLLLIDTIHRLEQGANAFALVTSEAERQASLMALWGEVASARVLITRLAHQAPGILEDQRIAVLRALDDESRLVETKLSLTAAFDSRFAALIEIDDAVDAIKIGHDGESAERPGDRDQYEELFRIVLTTEDVFGTLYRVATQRDTDTAPLEQRIATETAELTAWAKTAPSSPIVAEISRNIERLLPLTAGPASLPFVCRDLNVNRQMLAEIVRDASAKIETLASTAARIASGAEDQAVDTSSMTGQALAAARTGIAITVPLTFFGTLVVMWIALGRKVIDRLAKLAATTRQLAVGNLDAPIAVEGSDEITEISEALLLFRQWSVDKRIAEEDLKRTLEDVEHEKYHVEVQAAELVALAEGVEHERLAAVEARRIAKINEDQLRSVLDSVPDGIVIIDRAGIVCSFSPAAERLFGVEAPAMIGQSINRLMPPETASRHQGCLDRYYQHHSREVVGGGMRQVIGRHADGRLLPIDLSVNGAVIAGRPLLVSSMRDAAGRLANETALREAKEQAEASLDELRQAQQSLIQAEKLASLGALVAGVAHEINTPVSNCLTSASTLANETAETIAALSQGSLRKADLRRYFEAADELARLILSNMHRAAHLVSSFKRLSVDQTSEIRRVFRLHQCIDDVLFTLQPPLRQRACAVVVDCPDDMEIDGYPGALSQVLTNLVTNVLVHALEPGRAGRITIRAVRSHADGVTLSFADNGIGMAKAQLGNIFEPFFTTKRTSGGTGLGLHLVHNLVATALAGRIQVDSEEGRGTVFTIIFPRSRPEAKNRPEVPDVQT